MKQIFLCIAITTALVACASAKHSTPAIWRACDNDNCLYLLSSFHALQPTDYPMSNAVQKAYADAELLVFEVAPDELLSQELVLEMQKTGLLPASQQLQQLLPEKTWGLILKWIEKNPSYTINVVQQLKPWYLALIITNSQAKAKGFEASNGVEQYFMSHGKSNKKPSIGLEKAQQQIGLFNDMKLATQIELLQESLLPIEKKNNDLEQLHAFWKAGDVAGMEKITVQKMQREYPELYQSINVDRNNAWLPQLQNLLDKNAEQDVLVVVGALHLIGPDGVVKKLQSKGYKVERL